MNEPKSTTAERVAGCAAAGISGWIISRTGLDLGVETTTTILIGVYGVAHRLLRGVFSSLF